MAIQLFVPTFDVEACLDEIRECLEKGWTGAGFKTIEFEEAWKDYTGLPHAHFLNSATSGLHLALDIYKELYGWEDGDEVLTTPITFVSTNHAILHANLKPVFVDVDEFLCLDPDDVERKITPRTRAIVFVGLGGNTGQLARIHDICHRNELIFVLDAAHMAGTKRDGKTPSGDVTVHSFQAVKNLPTADAGMICFADGGLDAVARRKSWLGINKDTYARAADASAYKWQYEVQSVGYKYHGNSIMAAIALAQLPHLDAHNARRRAIGVLYDKGFAGHPHIATVPTAPGCCSSRHLYQIMVQDREKLIADLNARGINTGVHYRNNLEYPMFADQHAACPKAAELSQRVLSLPLHPQLSDNDVARVIEAVCACVEERKSLANA
ncbi:DegT/DnrJ/EryC1/StrS family aminotransferase [Hyphomicrobium denitrificans]|nr:DegT/DnrJ/EryC1/StrS family aminotransferase [Hyphomicrobium denitrificans]